MRLSCGNMPKLLKLFIYIDCEHWLRNIWRNLQPILGTLCGGTFCDLLA